MCFGFNFSGEVHLVTPFAAVYTLALYAFAL